MPFFNNVELLPEDPILSIPIAFAADTRPQKVNLGVGTYRTADGAPLILTCVRKAENQILQKNLNKEYLPIEGDSEYLNCGLKLLFGPEFTNIDPKNLFAAQAIGGSGALRIAGEFLSKNINKNIFLSQPSWPNHKQIFEHAGLNVGSYPYFDSKTNKLDFKGMCDAIKDMPPTSIILLQGSCHNPTGVDPSFEQWQELSRLIKQQQLVPLFDQAYQGFGQNLDKDAEAVRYFAKDGHEMFVCYSFAKNFGLYGERIGFLAVIASNPDAKLRLASQIKTIIRGNYSTPPLHGERIVKTILKNPELTQEWQTELENMRDRIKEMRLAFAADLIARGAHENYAFINKQNGLFSIFGLSQKQVLRLRDEKAIFMPINGRINIAGLTTQNLDYVVESIVSVL
ncbi:MAG: aspartate/tyrosine/aromatic aminotransferase [Parachlamydiaceae bacterium]|nr:aspartate/tyrosine/aromatic aminotransferase [Parachlamydiaceae bacterium]